MNPTNQDPLQDAKLIKQSISKPKNFNQLIDIVSHRSNAQRQNIVQAYYNNYNISIFDDLKSELSGNFKEAVIALFYTPIDYDCYQLYKAMKGLGTNEDTLIEIIATRSNNSINAIKARYPQMYNKNLVSAVQSDTSGFFRQILMELLKAERPNNPNPDQKQCEDCAKMLYDAEKLKKEALQSTYILMFTQKSKEEFALISKIYYQWYSKTFFDSIESNFSGDVRKVLKAITYALLSPSEYFAYRINKAIKGFGTNDTILIRVLVSRDEIDINRIKRYYKQLYKKELYDAVSDDVSGDYRTLLLALIGK
jgi:hypothetical protein